MTPKAALALVALMVALVVFPAGQPGYQTFVAYDRPTPVAVTPTKPVADQITRLGSVDSTERQAAWQALLGMAPEIQPQLQWALDSERRSMSRFRSIDYLKNGTIAGLTTLIDRADDRRRSTASAITLRHVNAPLLDVLRDLGSQVGAPVRVSSRPEFWFGPWISNDRVSLDLDRADYWTAVRAIWRDLRLNPSLQDEYVEFHRRINDASSRPPLDEPNAVTAGPLWIAPSVTREDPDRITVALDVAAEPRVRARRSLMVSIDEYADDRGQSLFGRASRPGGPITDVSSRPYGGGFARVAVQLPAPAPGRRIGTLKGRLSLGIGPPSLDLAILNLLRAGPQSFDWDGVVVTLTGVTRAGAAHVVSGELSASVDSPVSRAIANVRATDKGRPRPLLEFGLLNASGWPIHHEFVPGAVRREGGRDVIGWTLTTTEPAKSSLCGRDCVPTLLTWSTPTETRWLTVPFELRALAVPGAR